MIASPRALIVVAAAVVTASLLTACGRDVIYAEEVELPGVWTYRDSVKFSYEVADSDQAYDLTLRVGHTDTYGAQNMYVEFVTHFPDGARRSAPISLELADRFGQWLGTCSGADCELAIPIQLNATYPSPGRYGTTVYQHGRVDSLQGITSLGFEVAVSDTAE